MNAIRSRGRHVAPLLLAALGGALVTITSAATARQIDSLSTGLVVAGVLGAAVTALVALAISRPSDSTSVRFMSVRLEASADVLPHRIHTLALETIVDVAGVAAVPPPTCRTVRLGVTAVDYEIEFTLTDAADAAAVRSAALTLLWYRMSRANAVGVTQHTESDEVRAAAASTLGVSPLFDLLPENIRNEIAKHAEIEVWAAGERVVMQGDPGDSCFIVRSGRLSVHVADGDAETRFAELVAGDLFGEMSLLTGQARWATVRAEEDSELLRVSANAMGVALTQSPDLVARMAETVALRREELLEAKELLARREAEGRLTGAYLPSTIRQFMEIPDEPAHS
ncbi:MAG TPA: cyclic nucleotide-binding domain-containing protein [Thermoanaerobaculia bacterium]|nr:cyclic nucleotide-binding domain-containing protein [Thermoanaerobaculia bacterium]